jgi:hypothetical protein
MDALDQVVERHSPAPREIQGVEAGAVGRRAIREPQPLQHGVDDLGRGHDEKSYASALASSWKPDRSVK